MSLAPQARLCACVEGSQKRKDTGNEDRGGGDRGRAREEINVYQGPRGRSMPRGGAGADRGGGSPS